MKFSLFLSALALGTFMALGPAISSRAEDLAVGSPAPQFQCLDDSGKLWKTEDHYGKKVVVIYFYPAAMTPGCTKQACGFRDDMQQLKSKDVEVVGVSGDEVPGLQLFKKAYNLNFKLLSDPDGSVAKKFGVPVRPGGSIEREVDQETHVLKRGVTVARWTFVVDKNGKIALINSKVNAPEDSKAILAFLKKSNG